MMTAPRSNKKTADADASFFLRWLSVRTSSRSGFAGRGSAKSFSVSGLGAGIFTYFLFSGIYENNILRQKKQIITTKYNFIFLELLIVNSHQALPPRLLLGLLLF